MLQLFISFLKIGAFTFGGGYAMIALIEKEIVDKHHWLKKTEFLDVIALSQSMPGLFAANIASIIGKRIFGTKGALIAVAGVVIPSVVIILLIAMFFCKFQDNIYVERIFKGLRPCVVALIIVPCISLYKNLWKKSSTLTLKLITIIVPVLSCLLIILLGVSPVWIVIVSLIAGYAVSKTISRIQ